LTGCSDETRTTKLLSLLRSSVKRNADSAGLNSRLAWRNADCDASRTASEAASSRPTEVTSTSARKGWPSAD
jgi:hypothetical protein